MAAQTLYAELARQLNSIGALRRGLLRALPADCPSGPAATLSLLHRHGEMRMSRLCELLAVDMSVTSRHVAHAVDGGWVERAPDPGDRRSRLLRLTPEGTAKLRELHERSAVLLSRQLAEWSDGEIGDLIGMLERLRCSFTAEPRELRERAGPPAAGEHPEPPRRQRLPEAVPPPTPV
ncbi:MULTISPECIES: MarR family winged helix-turn-helix transcriptional regulator [Streptomyces]|uniref:MarR family transcriptional regulator n=1 Tax=Streptomyces tsukubensis (strain DSM 42081 / NBRC 108919 / NRRL 18488 / 9993) TaxID=1114943 RepID=I2N1P4_STRT9|nr:MULTISPECIES: MarR family transcriptional regulator [Streptomyces]AZK95098.1 MarR family transcriptional regulator [Streptomyces tsukubensis]EIF90941.1 MarR family transcriptional regulator [Streptomyces tsukubensis NRRL18488]MYS64175.1 MarR family transcriptional regulator [Streptomyces sp. SID5473]QKM68836.1 MarR family transcriptional regulator [Streptomyces tsukubensis NRRL18488]TAI43641.1 MarR family transcriptional regulator [Streptomyces tsukubensis]